MSRETAFVAAATAVALSPRTRETVRRGAVFGVAGALKAGDVVVGAARGAVNGVHGGDGAAAPDDGAAAPSPPGTSTVASSPVPSSPSGA